VDFFSSVFTWLSDHKAGISAVAAILAIVVILFTALRCRLRGDDSERPHHLGEVHRLFVEMGATGHAERLVRELGL
jgi:hypothetical protein